ncbi:MAG: hypothetical protein IT201_14585 [Thermoleophilia bacterium]|nr:hypothetical protein [Thermoleophilia bacterium]
MTVDLEQRLGRLEQEVRIWRRLMVVMVLAIATALTIGTAYDTGIVRARAFVLTSVRNETLAQLSPRSDGTPALTLFYEGRERVGLSIESDGRAQMRLDGVTDSGLLIRDLEGRERIRVLLDDADAGVMQLLGEDGETELWRAP